MNNTDKYLEMSDQQLDNILFGINLDSKESEIKIPKNICKNCKSSNLVTDNCKKHIVCLDCAVINGEFLDDNPVINNNSESSSYGCPSSFFYPKASLGTKISSKGYNRLSLLQRQGQMPYKEKSLMEVLNTIQAKCKKYNITQTIIDSAKILYKKVSESIHSKGERKGKNIIMRCINRRSMIAACLFHACKLQKETRSPREIADIYDLEIKDVNKGCRNFNNIMSSDVSLNKIKCSHPVDFIERFSKMLNIDDKCMEYAKTVATNIQKLDLASTHEPPSVAAGCILLVGAHYNITINKKDISKVFKISDVTISKTFRKIWPFHKIVVSTDIVDKILQKKNSKTNNNNLSIEELTKK